MRLGHDSWPKEQMASGKKAEKLGLGDRGEWGLGEAETRRHGDEARADTETRGDGDTETRGRGRVG